MGDRMSFYTFAKGVGKCLAALFFKLEIEGKENIPKDGGYVVCSNHIHVFDPIAIGLAFDREMNYLAKKELFKNKFFAKVLVSLGGIPIDREGTDLKAIKKSLKVLKDGEILFVFPEGTRNKTGEYIEPKQGVSVLAWKTKSKVVPVYIDARNKYKLFSKIIVRIGKPIDYTNFFDQKPSGDDYKNMSIDIMNNVFSLRKEGI